MAERVDVLIAGSGFGGAITAYRLAELYAAAGADAGSVVVLERGPRRKHTEFRQSMDIEHLSDVYLLIQGQGAQVVVANGVGGGSNLYLAASLRSPRETFERRDRAPGDGPERRMWPASISREALDPYYARVERGLRVRRPTWDQVSRSGGLWAANLRAAGHTADRVPLAISPKRCVDAKWCHTGCVFGAKNTLGTNYLPAAEARGVQIRPNLQVERIRQSQARPYRYVVTASVMDNEGDAPSRAPTGETVELECKVLVLAAGAMGTPPVLLRSRGDLPALSEHVGRHVGVNGDHIAAIEYDPARIERLLGLRDYRHFHMGKPITTMTYDFWAGRRSNAFDGTRFTLQEIFLSTLTNYLYADGREPEGEPSWWGLDKKRSVGRWNRRIELLAMVEDTHDGTWQTAAPQGGAVRPNAGPVGIGLFDYQFSAQSLAVREAADRAMRQIAGHRGLGRFLRMSQTRGAYAAHPLGGCRMADSADLGAVDDRGAVFGYEGLYCIDSSIIPSSLGVNPSLTIAAVAERCAEGLIARAGDLGLPAAPTGLRPRVPEETVGERVVPPWDPAERDRRRRRRARVQRRRRRHRASRR